MAECGRDSKTRRDFNGMRPKKTARWGDVHKAVHSKRRILPRGRRGRGARRWSTKSKTTRKCISSPQIVGQARRSGVGLCGWHHREHGGRVDDGGAGTPLLWEHQQGRLVGLSNVELMNRSLRSSGAGSSESPGPGLSRSHPLWHCSENRAERDRIQTG